MRQYFEYSIERRFLSQPCINELNTTFTNLFASNENQKKIENIVELKTNDLHRHPLIEVVSKKLVTHFSDIIGYKNIDLDKIWLVRTEAKHSDPHMLPYKPHFDKRRFLKAMLYLHDVTENHGPIHFGFLSDFYEIEKRRMTLPRNYKELSLNSIETKDLEGEMQPALGNAGDVVFFDTNAAHSAGIVSDGFTRQVFRFDFNVNEFN